jgi:hypothetical protein
MGRPGSLSNFLRSFDKIGIFPMFFLSNIQTTEACRAGLKTCIELKQKLAILDLSLWKGDPITL